jgi:hypothetical protein
LLEQSGPENAFQQNCAGHLLHGEVGELTTLYRDHSVKSASFVNGLVRKFLQNCAALPKPLFEQWIAEENSFPQAWIQKAFPLNARLSAAMLAQIKAAALKRFKDEPQKKKVFLKRWMAREKRKFPRKRCSVNLS